MIKLLACIFMLVDHIGYVFFPRLFILRIIGRLSMPLFSYAIARGFKRAYSHGTLTNYKRRILIFSVFSQIPYMLMVNKFSFNIGVLWLLCILFLERAEKSIKLTVDYIEMCIIIAFSIFVPMDYGIYGLLFTLLLYYYKIRNEHKLKLFIGFILIHLIKTMQNAKVGLVQSVTFLCILLIYFLEKYDSKIKVNRYFFYVFYPLHMTILVIIKRILM